MVPDDDPTDTTFDSFPLSEQIRRGILELGYTTPTPVQAAVVRPILAGKDLIVRSKTGTGKTAAFGVPLVERIAAGAHKVQVLIMTPTRELAVQVAEELAKLGKYKDLRFQTVYGGASMKDQLDGLREGAEFIIGTPGRIFDHIRRGTLDLSTARAVVLDEADEMLNQGFYEEVCRILDKLPPTRQTLLFSATVTAEIENLIKRFTRDPETILLSGDEYTVEGIENVRYETVDEYPKPRNLIYLIEREEPETAIVFCNTRSDTELISNVLNRNGYDAEMLNGDLPQKERERVMAKVKRGEVRFMVATDLAARGIDISDLSHVINYSLPEDPAVYLHRVGRTGRMSKKGTAISLVSGRELSTLSALEKKYKIKFEERKLPTPEEGRRMWTERHTAELKEALHSGHAFEAFIPLVEDLNKAEGGNHLLAYALKYFFQHHRMEKMAAQGHVPSEPTPMVETVEKTGQRRRERERKERGPKREHAAPRAAAHDAPATSAKPAPALEAASDSVRLWVNLGTADGLEPAGVASAVAELAQVPAAFVLKVEARKSHSFLFVEPVHVDAILAAHGRERSGKPLSIEKARRQ